MQNFKVGDQVKVHFKLASLARFAESRQADKSKETQRSKTQVFSGVVLAIDGQGISKTFKVLKDATAGIKVERTFPIESPLLEKVEVVKKPKKVKRAKLYFLRERGTAQL